MFPLRDAVVVPSGMRRWLGCALAFMVVALPATPGERRDATDLPAVQPILSSVQCGPATAAPTAMRIPDAKALQELFTRMYGSRITPPAPPVVDMTHWDVIYLSAGRKLSAGYTLSLASPSLMVEGKRALIRVHLSSPPPGNLVAAVITHPCLLVKIPRGAYETIAVHGLAERPIVVPVFPADVPRSP